MDRVVTRVRSFAEAEAYDIRQQIGMSPEERQRASRELKVRVYGTKSEDVRESGEFHGPRPLLP